MPAVAPRESSKLSKRAVAGFRAFASLMEDLSLAGAGSIENLLTTIIDRTGYTRPWEGSPSEQDQDRLANVQELVSAARQFDATFTDEVSLEAFLEQTCLASDLDLLDDSAGQVTLMTLHAAKGLEFPVVFIVGVEEGLIPHERAVRGGDPHELEEERRLLFVGMTRAREQLVLTSTGRRTVSGPGSADHPQCVSVGIGMRAGDSRHCGTPAPRLAAGCAGVLVGPAS